MTEKTEKEHSQTSVIENRLLLYHPHHLLSHFIEPEFCSHPLCSNEYNNTVFTEPSFERGKRWSPVCEEAGWDTKHDAHVFFIFESEGVLMQKAGYASPAGTRTDKEGGGTLVGNNSIKNSPTTGLASSIACNFHTDCASGGMQLQLRDIRLQSSKKRGIYARRM